MATIFTQAAQTAQLPQAEELSSKKEVFKCEVCRISLRSAKKLEDHVKFSPLHQSWLKKPISKKEEVKEQEEEQNSSGKKGIGRQRLIYDGTKLFWRLNQTFDIHIYEDIKNATWTVLAYKQDHALELPRLVLDLKKIEDYLANNRDETNTRSDMVQFILTRLHAKEPESAGQAYMYIEKKYGDSFDDITKQEDHSDVPTTRQRRHTLEDVQQVQTSLNEEIKELRSGRIFARRMSDATGLSLDLFQNLMNQKKEPRHATDGMSSSSHSFNAKDSWLGALDRVNQQSSVEKTKAILSGKMQYEKELTN